jgi:hypothetical protein
MADVFISYARPDREIARGLASALIARGYQVWWDFELLGGEEFRDAIMDELKAAKAVIVIWTGSAAKSRWVRDEAERAQAQGKLVATCVDGFDTKALPLGFGGLHCHPVSDIDKTVKAISKLQAVPAASKTDMERAQLAAEEKFWASIENSTDPSDFEIYLEEYPNGVHRAFAKVKLKRFKPGSQVPNYQRHPKGSILKSFEMKLIIVIALVVAGAYLLYFDLYVLYNGSTPTFWLATAISMVYSIISIFYLGHIIRSYREKR